MYTVSTASDLTESIPIPAPNLPDNQLDGEILIYWDDNKTVSYSSSCGIYSDSVCANGVSPISLSTGSRPRCPLRYHSLVCIKNHLFIVGIEPNFNKDLEFIYQSDRSDRTCVYS